MRFSIVCRLFNETACILLIWFYAMEWIHGAGFTFSHQFVFESFAPDVELHSGGTGTRTGSGTTGAEVAAASSAASAVGAVVVLCPADFVDGDTAKSSTPQGKPPTAGVIPSHDHCSHTRITVTAWERGKKTSRGEKRMKRNGVSSTVQNKWYLQIHCIYFLVCIT